MYYVKPYSRLPVFLLGVIAGCAYFSFKKEHGATERYRIPKILEALQYSGERAVASCCIGVLLMAMMIGLM